MRMYGVFLCPQTLEKSDRTLEKTVYRKNTVWYNTLKDIRK